MIGPLTMKKRIWLIAFVAAGCVILCASCDDDYKTIFFSKNQLPLPKRIVTNKIGIKKVELPPVAITQFSTSRFPECPPAYTMTGIAKAVFGIVNIWQYETIVFGNNLYHIGTTDDNMHILFVNNNSLKKVVKKIDSPRPRRIDTFKTFVTQFGTEKYLVLGVKNHPRANCSLFFVLDKNLDIVYEEHSLHAFEIGMYHDEKYGDCVIVKSGNFHPYNVKGDEKYYMYYLPKMERLADAPVR